MMKKHYKFLTLLSVTLLGWNHKSFAQTPSFLAGSGTSIQICQDAAGYDLTPLMNINDGDIGQLETWSVQSGAGPAHGSLSGFPATAASNGSSVGPTLPVSYTPTTGYSGTDAFSIVVNDGMGDADTIVINVTVIPAPTAITGTTAFCEGKTGLLLNSVADGIWSSSNTLVASIGAANGVVGAIKTGKTIISYSTGCGTDATTVVSVKANPMASLTGSNACIGSLLTVSGTPYSNIEWKNGGTTFKITPSAAGMDAAGTSIGTSDGITPMGVFVTPGGDMYVADIFSNRIMKYNAGFNSTSTGTVVAADGLSLPSSVYVDAAGNIYVANFGSNNIIEFPAGSTSTTVGTVVAADGLNGPSYVTLNGAGDIYVADNNNNRVIVFPAGSTSTTPGTVRASGFTNVQSIYLDPSDTMYVADFSGNSILKYAPGSGTGTIVAGGNGAGSAANQFSSAAGVAVDANGNVYVSDKDNHRVQMFPSGSTSATNGVTIAGTGIAGSGSSELSSPMNLFADNYGNVYIADLGNNRVQVYHSGAITDTTTTMTGGEYSAIVTGNNGCIVTTNTFHINTVGAITGTMQVCEGLTTNLSDTSAGGTWSSSDVSIATIDATTGAATGVLAGTTTITYTTPAGCTMTGELTVNPLPSAITGAAAVCEGQTTTLGIAESGVWSSGSIATATVDAGTGVVTGVAAGNSVITFTLPTTCISTTTITVHPIPVAYAVTGGGNYCAGDTGVVVGLISSDAGINYQLYNGTAITGADSTGTGAAINFGLQTAAGSYTIVATNNTTSCTNTMTSAAIVGINPLPAVYNVTGGGNYCDMGAGVPVGLDGSDIGFDYLLYKGGAIVASPMAGTGSSLNFGLQKGAGSYTIVSVDAITGCRSLMFDSAGIIVNPLVLPTISLSTSLYDTVCEGYMDTFTAVITNGGAHPFYQWTVNGVNAGTNSPTFSYMPVNGDVVVALLISDAACVVTPATATTSITVKAERIFIPAVTITSSHGKSIVKGEQVTLEAEVANAGPAPKYQWLKNGIAISGATTKTYVTSTLNNGDSITCVVMGTGRCSYPSFNSITVNVHGLGISELATTSNIQVMPNPSKGAFTINGTLGSSDDADVTLSITNLVGQVIYNQQVRSINGAIAQDIQLSNAIPRGMYLLSVRTPNENKVIHLIIE